ncbi:hypothetical protein E8E13_001168 [Curvularia kusanoi]|uniref:F-box domain-containing protein n=1 Tax=Curvularia kusanoi TaxID=90978 RepID=A0A9P4T3F9_CURKU|nr:hypothetical protein E8E13_001168 [Curvularia kusanoi]
MISRLPQEIIDQISLCLDRDDLKRVLFLSRTFQRAAERASGVFASFAFKHHDPAERQDFLTKFTTHRFRFLRQVEIFTKFPPIDEATPIPCRESSEQLLEKDEAFTAQIMHAWATMRLVEAALDHGVGKAQIRVYAPTRIVEGDVCDHKRYSSWRVHLLDPEQLPQLNCVRALTVCDLADKDLEDNAYRSKLDLRATLDLAARCPNLEYLGCKVGADDWASTADPWVEHFMHDFPGCRRDTRNDFANAGRDVGLPASLKYVQLDFINATFDSVEEQRRPPPNLVYPHLFDSFSSSLRLLSSQLRRLDLHVMADDTLFWPRDDTMAPSWPNLEIFAVLFHSCSPSGKWYFQSPLGTGRDDESFVPAGPQSWPPLQDQEEDSEWCFESMDGTPNGLPAFRVVPIEGNLEPLLVGFVKATAKMPKLLEGWLWTPLSYHPYDMPEEEDAHISALYPEGEFGWGLMYSAPGAPISGGGCTATRELKWRVGPWRPAPELRNLSSKIGQEQILKRTCCSIDNLKFTADDPVEYAKAALYIGTTSLGPTSTQLSTISEPTPGATQTGTEGLSDLPTSTTTPTPGVAPSQEASSSGLGTGAKVGLGVGIPVGVLALAAIGAFFWMRRRKQSAGTKDVSELHAPPADNKAAVPPYRETAMNHQGAAVYRHEAPSPRVVAELPGSGEPHELPQQTKLGQ